MWHPTTNIGDVDYQLKLVGWFSYIQTVFYVSLLHRLIAGGNEVAPPETIEAEDT